MDLMKKKQKMHQKRLQALKKKIGNVSGTKHKLPFDDDSDDDDDGDDIFDNVHHDDDENALQNYMDTNANYVDTWFDDEEFVQFDNKSKDEEEIQVDFDVALPNMERDFDGVQLYLRNFLRGDPSFNYVEFTELVMGDAKTGKPNPCTSVLKIDQSTSSSPEDDGGDTKEQTKHSDDMEEDDDDEDADEEIFEEVVDTALWEWNDIYGVISCLDMHKHKDAECVKQISQYVLDKCADVRLKTQLRELLHTNRIGLIVNERVVNLPVEVSPILHDNLHKEIQEGIKSDQLSLFQYYLILSKVYFESEMASATSDRISEDILGRKTKKMHMSKMVKEQKFNAEGLNKAQRSYLMSRSDLSPHFYKPEEEFYYAKSTLKFSFPLVSDGEEASVASMDKTIRTEGLVMLVERDKLPKILKTIHRMFDLENLKQAAEDEPKQQQKQKRRPRTEDGKGKGSRQQNKKRRAK